MLAGQQRGSISGRECAHVVGKCVDDGLHRQTPEERLTRAPQPQGAAVDDLPAELGNQRGLADAGLALHHHEPATSELRPCELVAEAGQLTAAADERAAGRGLAGRGPRPYGDVGAATARLR